MYVRRRATVYAGIGEIDMLELTLAAETVIHDMFLKVATERWLSEKTVPKVKEFLPFLDRLIDGTECFREVDREHLKCVLFRVCREVKDRAALLLVDDEPFTDESFPELWGTNDMWSLYPVWIGMPGRMEFGDGVIEVPGIGTFRCSESVKPERKISKVQIRFTEGEWRISWREWRAVRPPGKIWRAREKNGKVTVVDEDFPGRNWKRRLKEEAPRLEELHMGTVYMDELIRERMSRS